MNRFAIMTLLSAIAFPALAERVADAADAPSAADYQKAVDRAVDFLKTKGQAEDGSFSSFAGPGVTALVLTGALENGVSPNEPFMARGLKWLEGFVQADGGIYRDGSFHRNYETSIAMLAFDAANRDGRYDELLEKAQGFLKGIQWDEDEGHDRSSTFYGGAGYGGSKRPDMSNTSFLIDALKTVGKKGENDEALQKALVFVSRCQNLESEHNATEFAPKVNDGGFYYTVAAGGQSKAGETPDGGLRSYGSMTYAGLKSMIYDGVDPEDPRVKAAFTWIRKHYTLAENPGMDQQGLYYYYHIFAKALDAMEVDTFVDDVGVEHDWRAELGATLLEKQSDDGSWINPTERWLEKDPNLVTGYVLMTLSYVRPESN